MSSSSNSLSSCMYANTHKKDRLSPAGIWSSEVHATSGWSPLDPSPPPGGPDPTWTTLEPPGSASAWGLEGARRTVPGTGARRRLGRRARSLKTPTPCKHVPHREKPPQIVARRNARERRRVEAVNTAFLKLRRVVPIDNNRGKRVSKVKTLHKAIEYISYLQRQLDQGSGSYRPLVDLNKENKRWGVEVIHHHETLADLLIGFDEEDF